MKKRTFNVLMVTLAVALVASLASAAIIPYFGQVQTTMDVKQSIVMDDGDWDEPITTTIEEAYGGCCYCYEHTVENNGCEGVWLDWQHTGDPDLEGIDILVLEKTICEPKVLTQLVLNVLDGQADDSFCVWIDDVCVYSYTNGDPPNDPEEWFVHTIDIAEKEIPCCGTHEIKIRATGPKWAWWETYGQVAVDYIQLWCGDTMCGEVDIGDTASEAGHNLVGWGPIEPATSGGNWGSIDDCRVIWEGGCNNGQNACIDIACEGFCGECEGGCDCNNDPIEFPYYLGPGDSLDFCMCYKLSIMIHPDIYIITSRLIPTT